MYDWMQSWLEKRFAGSASGPARIRSEELGPLPFAGPVAIWHPMDDLHAAPTIPFETAPRVEAVWVGDELAGYLFRAVGEPVTWETVGDASTSGDRFFLVPLDAKEAAIAWLNELFLDFERLGGETPMQVVEHANGTRLVVLVSSDGNARIRGGRTADGRLACALLET